ncbi:MULTISPECIES: SDR family oxidoreductase [unclassified Mycobacterium]|uniref:SDR family NAD(P)-dependent oxidoreductase n=1 Tax=unclassified Mycobacterium TaxID=2642494 RepID=UPI0029C879D6|nr:MULTISPECIES: SDR family oxidoreductase [unclassified Mycobacterium]
MPIAVVTGASRGIGKAIAVHLARAGFDVALIARTFTEGEQREHSSTVRQSDTSPLPGSLTATAEAVADAGARSLTVCADLVDRPSIIAAADRILAEWGPADVLVNNGRYIGPGHMDRFLDTPLELLDLHLEANVMAPLTLTKKFLPGMLERGAGRIVNISSGAGTRDPDQPAGEGGWGLGYGMSKGALHRIAGILALELGDRGILAYNVQPGFIATERMIHDMAAFGFDASGAPPDVVGAVVAWLVTDPAAAQPNGRSIEAQDVCAERGLLPGWPA